MSMLTFSRCRPYPEWLAFTRSQRWCRWVSKTEMQFRLWSPYRWIRCIRGVGLWTRATSAASAYRAIRRRLRSSGRALEVTSDGIALLRKQCASVHGREGRNRAVGVIATKAGDGKPVDVRFHQHGSALVRQIRVCVRQNQRHLLLWLQCRSEEH